MGIDESRSGVSYTGFNAGFNTDGSRAAGVDIPGVGTANPTCKHIEGDLSP